MRVPIDVLREIFIFVNNLPYSDYLLVMVVPHVCRLWRQVCLTVPLHVDLWRERWNCRFKLENFSKLVDYFPCIEKLHINFAYDFIIHIGKDIAKCTRLKSLDLSFMYNVSLEFFDTVLPALTSLSLLHLRQCAIKENMLDRIAACKSLESLDISNCKYIHDIGVLKKCTTLTDLSCRGLDITDICFVSHLPNLTSVDLSFCTHLQNARWLSLCPLTRLILAGCIEIKDLYWIKYCTQMKVLNLDRCMIDDRCLECIGALEALEALSLQSCEVLDSGLQSLTRCTNLTYLDLSNNSNITDRSLAWLVERDMAVDVRGCSLLTARSFFKERRCRLLYDD